MLEGTIVIRKDLQSSEISFNVLVFWVATLNQRCFWQLSPFTWAFLRNLRGDHLLESQKTRWPRLPQLPHFWVSFFLPSFYGSNSTRAATITPAATLMDIYLKISLLPISFADETRYTHVPGQVVLESVHSVTKASYSEPTLLRRAVNCIPFDSCSPMSESCTKQVSMLLTCSLASPFGYILVIRKFSCKTH